MPWRFDRVHVAADGTAWVSTTFSAEDSGGWVEVAEAEELAALLTQVLDDTVAPEVVSIPADDPCPGARTGSRGAGDGVVLAHRLALGGARRAAGSRRRRRRSAALPGRGAASGADQLGGVEPPSRMLRWRAARAARR